MLFLNSNIAIARCLVLVAAILRDCSLYSVNESVGDRNVCFISCFPVPMMFQSHFFRLNVPILYRILNQHYFKTNIV